MDTLLSFRCIGISDLCGAPARAFEQAGNEAVVVLNHSRPLGYIVSQALMAHILDQLADHAVADKARERLASLDQAQKITLDKL